MTPKIIEENEREYFICPKCEKVVLLSWDTKMHRVIYAKQCSECGQELKWNKKLIDLKG